MVSKKSAKKAWNEGIAWARSNPHAPITKVATHSAKMIHDALEMDIRLATTPSLVMPIPKRAVDQIQQHIDKFRIRR